MRSLNVHDLYVFRDNVQLVFGHNMYICDCFLTFKKIDTFIHMDSRRKINLFVILFFFLLYKHLCVCVCLLQMCNDQSAEYNFLFAFTASFCILYTVTFMNVYKYTDIKFVSGSSFTTLMYTVPLRCRPLFSDGTLTGSQDRR